MLVFKKFIISPAPIQAYHFTVLKMSPVSGGLEILAPMASLPCPVMFSTPDRVPRLAPRGIQLVGTALLATRRIHTINYTRRRIA